MKEGAVVGIDLGTTYSLVAVMDGRSPRVLANALGETLTPSAVSIDEDGTVLVGAPARARSHTHPTRTAVSFKRDMGTDALHELSKEISFRPEDLSALVLRQLREDAEAALGRPITEAVVTVPAYFGELQRRATRDACAIAGVPVERIINEPTAAALAYGLQDMDREVRAVVLDLGGGTFDVTVLEIIEGVIEIQASAGDSRLGGDDFAEALVEHCQKRIEREHGAAVDEARAARRLWEACEQTKKLLSDAEQSRVALVDLELSNSSRIDVEIAIDREKAEQLWAPLLKRIEAAIGRALRDADLRAADVEEVLLVGGSTRMPCVRSLAAKLFGRLPNCALAPDETVALGAAVQAALKADDEAVEDLVVTDVAPFSLGVAAVETMGPHLVAGVFAPILERGTVLPASRVKSFSTVSKNQKILEVEVYQGEHSLVADNQKIGAYEIKGIPPAPAGEQELEIRFTYDLNGILEVETTIAATKKSESLVIDRSGGKKTKRELEKARKAMERLKFHPRDALPNRTALARGDALHVELTGIERDMLGSALNAFRLALETQDSAMIKDARDHLNASIEQLRR